MSPFEHVRSVILQRQSRVAQWCERAIEGGWLLALVLIPSYFNLLSSRHFEPDKATTLRAIVLAMIVAVVIRWLDHVSRRQARPPAEGGSAPAQGRPSPWQRLRSFPMGLPIALYALVFLIATAFSVTPYASFWGSYQRLQGAYTNLSYVALGVMIALYLRRHAQVDRLVTMLVLGSLPAACYGLIQHLGVDPLPWRGDVISRVASTMGNSIFVAAYMILVLPFALYRGVAALREARLAPQSERGAREAGWGAAYALLVLGGLLIAFAAIEFGAVVQAADLRYWWVLPGALLAFFGLCLVPALEPHRAERIGRGLLIPGIVALGYVLLVGASFAIGQLGGGQVMRPIANRPGVEWPLWMVMGFAMVAIGYGLLLTLPRRAGAASRLMLRLQGLAMLAIAALLLVVIFFTQSRGPWLGLLAGLFVFFTLLLWLAMRVERETPRYGLWRNLLIAHLALTLLLGGFLVAFNTLDTPVFHSLKSVPYIGRMGRLLEVDEGTGLVRKLIWLGDDKAGGAVALIKSDPIRMLIGWGPESMFVAYNRFYPPSLANIESRGASPDRSHQAYLDELINKGVLGLISYLFVLLSFFALAWRLLRTGTDRRLQILLIACIAALVSHGVEGLTGIPIVSTLMLQWVTIGLVVAIAAIVGAYQSQASEVAEQEAPEEAPVAAPEARQRGRARSRRPVARGSGAGRGPARQQESGGAAAIAIYSIVAILGLVAIWSFNIDNVYADMRFQEGQTYTEDPQADLSRYIVGTSYYLDAIRMEPGQDFYYLNLGRSLMSIVDIRRQTQGVQLGQPIEGARVEDLLRLGSAEEVQQFVQERPPLELMSYAEAVLTRAHDLSPLNKDHYANLARMYNFWYSRLTHDPKLLELAVDWYRRGSEIAPQDVTILNEYASAVTLQGTVLRDQGDAAGAQQKFELASQLLEHSAAIDPRYRDTNGRMADVLRLQGQYAQAVDRYVAILADNPRALDGQISSIIESMRSAPDQLLRLRAAYEAALQKDPGDITSNALIGLISARAGDLPRAAAAFSDVVRLQPQNLEARQNYTLVLSDMMQYQQASAEAEQLLQMAQQQQLGEADRNSLEALAAFLREKVAAP
jgi:tetratricopeptide (TPR) repeat protein/O-antigen ligase